MAYGSIYSDTVQSSVASTPPVIRDGNSTEIGQFTKAWVNHAGGAPPTPRASFNISTITRTATGSYTITFTNTMADSNYCVYGSADGTGMTFSPAAYTSASSFTALVARASEGQYDRTYVCFAVNR